MNGPRKPYVVADEAMPARRGAASRADVAHFMLDELAARAHVNKMVGMAG